ncbi:hypothetical protein VUR80DRAFT_8821 [Thermomyces stellatus]
MFASFLNPSPPPQRPLSPVWEYVLYRRGRRPRSVSVWETFLRTKGREAWQKTKPLKDLENDEYAVEIADGQGGWVTYNSPSPQKKEAAATAASTEIGTADSQPRVHALEHENGSGTHDNDSDEGWGRGVFSTYVLEIIRGQNAQGAAGRTRESVDTSMANFFDNVDDTDDLQMAGTDDVDKSDIDLDDFVVVRPLPLLANTARARNSSTQATVEPTMPITDAHGNTRTPSSNQQEHLGRNGFPVYIPSLGSSPGPLTPPPGLQQQARDQDGMATRPERPSLRRNGHQIHNPELWETTTNIAPALALIQEDECSNGMAFAEPTPLLPILVPTPDGDVLPREIVEWSGAVAVLTTLYVCFRMFPL